MMENKQQMVHIIAEIVAMVAMVFYFNQKHKKVLTIVEDLSQRIEEQEDLIQKHLYSSSVSEIDLLIRTGDEKRISNFMPWQLSYSEIFFSDILWPDFSEKDMIMALNFFSERDRRYGKLNTKI